MKIIIGFLLVLTLLIAISGCNTVANNPTTPTAPSSGGSESLAGMDAFAQCLTDNGAVMYGTSWCGFCNRQKEDFGDSFQYVVFVDCDADRASCESAGVKAYPTWVIDGEIYRGKQPLTTLATATGCELEE